MRTSKELALLLLGLAALSCGTSESSKKSTAGSGGSAAAGASGSMGDAGLGGAPDAGGAAGSGNAGTTGDAGAGGGAGSAGNTSTGGTDAGGTSAGGAGDAGSGNTGGTGVHARALLVDGHNDLPWALREAGGLQAFDLEQAQPKFNTDIPRLRQGNVGAQFWSAYVPTSTIEDGTAVATTLEQIALIHELVTSYADTFELALTASDIRRIHADGKIASLIGVEGGHSIANALATLDDLYAKGARYMTLSHNKNLDWVESANDVELPEALTAFGKQVVHEMNALGMLVDISHISARAMREVLAVAQAPLIASHSSAYALNPNPRNVPDDVLRQIVVNGGVVMVTFYPGYLAPTAPPGLPTCFTGIQAHACQPETLAPWSAPQTSSDGPAKVVDHIEHIIEVAGIDHVGIGSDFDGLPALPAGLEDVSKFPNITAELLRRGYSEADIDKILGENFMRVFEAAERRRQPSTSKNPAQRARE